MGSEKKQKGKSKMNRLRENYSYSKALSKSMKSETGPRKRR